MDILSEEEVSYYKKSLISQEGSIKKGAPGDAPVVAKSALRGDVYPLPFTLLIKVDRADLDPRRSASSSSFSALSTSPFLTACLMALLK